MSRVSVVIIENRQSRICRLRMVVIKSSRKKGPAMFACVCKRERQDKSANFDKEDERKYRWTKKAKRNIKKNGDKQIAEESDDKRMTKSFLLLFSP